MDTSTQRRAHYRTTVKYGRDVTNLTEHKHVRVHTKIIKRVNNATNPYRRSILKSRAQH
jgi:hypothetical protein